MLPEIEKFIASFFPKQNIKSPVGENNTLNDQYKMYYVNRMANNELASTMNNNQATTPTPAPVTPTPSPKQNFIQSIINPPVQKAAAESDNPSLDALTKKIAQGFVKYGRPEAAQYAKYFAQAGQGLPDPYMPATLSLKETSGGKNLFHANNWLNIGPEIDYPDVPSNIVGGNGKKGFTGVIHNGLYDKYLKSKDLNDFFSVYTPHTYSQANGSTGYNGTYPEQIQQYNNLRNNFTQ